MKTIGPRTQLSQWFQIRLDDVKANGLRRSRTEKPSGSAGIESESFSSGDRFLELRAGMPSYRPDCVILDVQMPGLNGLEVQKRLAGSGLPIIFITAHEDSGVRVQALAAGAVAFLRKPFNGEILIKAVRAALGRGPVENTET